MNTIALHLEAIKNPEILSLYKAAGLASLALTELTIEQQAQIKDLLL